MVQVGHAPIAHRIRGWLTPHLCDKYLLLTLPLQRRLLLVFSTHEFPPINASCPDYHI